MKIAAADRKTVEKGAAVIGPDGTIFAGGWCCIQAIDGASGTVKWINGEIYVRSQDGSLYALQGWYKQKEASEIASELPDSENADKTDTTPGAGTSG